jgi:hypothetical protein
MDIGQLTGGSNRENDMKKKHSAIVMGTVVVLAIGVALVIQVMAGGEASSDRSADGDAAEKVSTAEKVTEAVSYAEITDLKGKLHLDASTLAAMGCTEADTEAVLKEIKTWYASNAAQFKANRAAEMEAVKSLRSPQKDGRMDQVDLAAARRSLQASVKARRELIKNAKEGIEVILPQAKRKVWAAARANAGLPSPYRFISGLTKEQRASLRDARTALARRQAAATDEQQRIAAQEAFGRTVDQTLNFTQKQDLQRVKGNLQRCSSKVASATSKVLPKPVLLQEQPSKPMPEMTEELRRKLETKLDH